jgi:hypothetical protein
MESDLNLDDEANNHNVKSTNGSKQNFIPSKSIINDDRKVLAASPSFYNNMISDINCAPDITYMTLKYILGLKGGMANEMDTEKTRKRRLYDQSRQQKYNRSINTNLFNLHL